jgi:N4-(beta-N-acetylglucosaminyl)-L-asparaginase
MPVRYLEGLTIATWKWGVPACDKAWQALLDGGSALDAAVIGVTTAEDNPEVRTVGFGGKPDASGQVSLDACVFDGKTRKAGAVSYLRQIRNAAAVARLVMEKTSHVMLAGEGAGRFAVERGFPRENLLSDESEREYEEWKRAPSPPMSADAEQHDTITQIVQDFSGDLAGACSTSGTAWKTPGRVGDSSIPGAGLYVDNEIGAAGATGRGEIAMRNCLSFLVVELMRNGLSPQEACEAAIRRAAATAPADENSNSQMALIAIDIYGNFGAYSMMPVFPFAVTKGGKAAFLQAGSLRDKD